MLIQRQIGKKSDSMSNQHYIEEGTVVSPLWGDLQQFQ